MPGTNLFVGMLAGLLGIYAGGSALAAKNSRDAPDDDTAEELHRISRQVQALSARIDAL